METPDLGRKKIFDGVQRLIHWWIAVTVTALVGLGWFERFTEVNSMTSTLKYLHMGLGFGLTIGFCSRLIWGWIGPEHAQFQSLWKNVLRRAKNHPGPMEEYGHAPAAGIAYLAFYVMLAFTVGSGLMLAAMRYDRGPLAAALFDELAWHEITLQVHNLALYGATLFLLSHIVGMILHERKSGLPVAQAMMSGYQYRKTEKKEE